jgi:nucleoside-diphosphate-sugar epimerase
MSRLLIFGPGYTASRIAAKLEGWHVVTIGRAEIADRDRMRTEMAAATHILSSVPPDAIGDPVLAQHGDLIAAAPARWIGYLSSTGVYGDTGGAWVDESAPIGRGRRDARTAADLAWQQLHPAMRVFRLPGIYGPGRSALDRVRAGSAQRIDLPQHVFSRIHVDDIAEGVLASMSHGPAGVFNLADDRPASQNAVIEEACRLLGAPPPPMMPLDGAALTPAARAFYGECRRVANGKATRLLGWRPRHRDFRSGLRAIAATEIGQSLIV